MNIAQRLIKADQTSPKLILVIGDGMTDIYIHGRLEDTCQEGCQKFIEEKRIAVPGGAANAARSLSHWYTRAVFLGPTRAGPTKTRFIAKGGDGKDWCAFRHDDDHVNFHLSLVREESMYALTKLPRRPNAVLLTDYDKGMLTPEFIKEVMDECKNQDIPCVADCKQEPMVYDGCVAKCNYNYSKRFGFNPPEGNCTDIPRPFVITQGSYGPIIVERGRGADRVDGHNRLPLVPCVNHVGAGDCFAAHLTLALAHGFSLRDAAAIAHSAGRVYVQHPHNRPPRPEEIAEDMENV